MKNRVIKFRAWQRHYSLDREPGMYKVSDIIWYDAPDSDLHTGEVFFEGSPSSEYLEDVLLMQFTGVQDKDGVDIYEGDILCERWEDYEPKSNVFVVTFDKDVPRFVVYNAYQSTVKVLGNIYEHPELVKKHKLL